MPAQIALTRSLLVSGINAGTTLPIVRGVAVLIRRADENRTACVAADLGSSCVIPVGPAPDRLLSLHDDQDGGPDGNAQ